MTQEEKDDAKLIFHWLRVNYDEFTNGCCDEQQLDSGIEEIGFHSSWDSIFPVIDKINALGKEYSFAIFKTYVSLTVEKGGKVFKDFSFAYSEYITATQTGKQAAFKLVVKFIKWHNENKLQKDLVESK